MLSDIPVSKGRYSIHVTAFMQYDTNNLWSGHLRRFRVSGAKVNSTWHHFCGSQMETPRSKPGRAGALGQTFEHPILGRVTRSRSPFGSSSRYLTVRSCSVLVNLLIGSMASKDVDLSGFPTAASAAPPAGLLRFADVSVGS
jgi:hypothetical protein